MIDEKISPDYPKEIGRCTRCKGEIYNGSAYWKIKSTGELICDDCLMDWALKHVENEIESSEEIESEADYEDCDR